MHSVKVLRLMLGYLKHLQGQNMEAVLFELFNDVANAIFLNRVWLDDGERALQSLHRDVVGPWSFVVGRPYPGAAFFGLYNRWMLDLYSHRRNRGFADGGR